MPIPAGLIGAQPWSTGQKRAGLDPGSLAPHRGVRRVLRCGGLPHLDPAVYLRPEKADPSASVPRKANALREPAVLFPAPECLPADVKQAADLLHRIEPFHHDAPSLSEPSRWPQETLGSGDGTPMRAMRQRTCRLGGPPGWPWSKRSRHWRPTSRLTCHPSNPSFRGSHRARGRCHLG